MKLEKFTLNTIDPEKWNALVLSHNEAPFYCILEILKSLHDNWEFLVGIGTDERYQWGIPIPVKRFFGLKRVVQPAFCQQLGVLGITGTQTEVQRMLGDLKGVISWAYHFNESNKISESPINGAEVQTKTNLVLNLSGEVENIRSGYSQNLKRKLKTASKNNLNLLDTGLQEFWPIFEREYSNLDHSKDKKHLCLKKVLEIKDPIFNPFLVLVKDADQNVMAGGIFIGFQNRVSYWSGFSTSLGKEKGAMAFLMDQNISNFQNSYKEFDFESGNLSGTSRFFTQFKPEERPFPVLIKTPKLPF